MADKELTVFLVDSRAPWHAYDYLFHTLAAKLLKGLKTDYVSVVAFNGNATDHSRADTGKFVGVNVLMDFEAVTYDKLKEVKTRLSSLRGKQELDNASDSVQTILFSSQLFQPTLKKVFTRNIVLIAESDPSTEHLDQIPRFYENYPVYLYVIHENADATPVYKELCDKFASGRTFSYKDATNAVAHHHPIKKVRPVSAYKGQLRFGADFRAMLNDPSYMPERDGFCSCFNIELYPAVKHKSLPLLTHDYTIDDEEVIKVKRTTSHFVLEKDAQGKDDDLPANVTEKITDDVEKNYSKVAVDSHSLTPGLKFSNFDLIALDDDLLKSTKLNLQSGLDIIGFIKSDSLPQHMFTEEPFFVVPEKASLLRDTSSFFAFVEALYSMNLAALARLVRKQEKEVEVGALLPVRIKRSGDYTSCFLFIRLPFKEDEKIGNFPPLAKARNPVEDEEEDGFDESAVNSLMEDFIEARTAHETIDDIEDQPSVVKDSKVTLLASETSKLALPPKSSTKNPLLCTSPSATKFLNYLHKILLGSLDADEWVQHFTNPKFIEDNIRGEDTTNFYTLANCLTANSTFDVSSWLGNLSSSTEAEKRLVEELDIKYERREESKKQKVSEPMAGYMGKGNYGADEGDYGEVPDFGL